MSQREERESYWERMFVFLTQNSYSFTVLLVQLHHLSPPLFLSLASASVLPTVSAAFPSLPCPPRCLLSASDPSLLGVWPGSPEDNLDHGALALPDAVTSQELLICCASERTSVPGSSSAARPRNRGAYTHVTQSHRSDLSPTG